MSEFVLSQEIDRPPADVFAFLADSQNTPLWYQAVLSVRQLTPGPVREGTVYRMVRRLPEGRVENEVGVSELRPVQRVTLRSLSGPTPFTYRYSLAPAGDGTRLTLEGTISVEGLPGLAALVAPLAGPIFKRGMAANLRVLKRLLEEGT